MAPGQPFSATKPGCGLTVIGAEAKVALPDGRVATRELLRVDEERRFELRPSSGPGMVIMDLGPGVVNVTLAGQPHASVEIELVVLGVSPLLIDAWCSAGSNADADIRLIDGFGRLAVPDLAARGPTCDALELTSGRYLLAADVCRNTVSIRIAQRIAAQSLRAAV